MKIVFLIATLLVLSCNKFSAGGGNLLVDGYLIDVSKKHLLGNPACK